MKSIKCDLPSELDQIKIEIFSDLHIGSAKCDYKSIEERIDKVKNNPDTYLICLGDFLNNSTKTSVGDVYSEELTPMQQINKAIDIFEPVKDKILAITAGNHERRSYKTDGIDLGKMFAQELKMEAKYDYCACLLFIRFGAQSRNQQRKMWYTLYATHGDGQGGRTIGSKANGLQRRGQIIPQADIILTGHTHAPMTFRDSYFEICHASSTVKKREQVFVNASATLDYEEYAELNGMKPSSKASPVIVLSGKKKEINVVI